MINFPDNPVVDQVFYNQGITYVWDGVKWKAAIEALSYVATSGSYTDLINTPTPSDILADIKTVDGSGSGLDADTLDGKDLATIENNIAAAVPSGAVMSFATATSPTGWLSCDGSAVSRSSYSDLFTAIGTTYGSGDGSTTFNLPDLRGEFVRGLDEGRGVDSGRTLGSSQSDDNKSHSHTGSTNTTGSHGHSASTNSAGYHGHSGSTNTTGNHSHSETLYAGGAGPEGYSYGSGSSYGSYSVNSAGNHSHSLSINGNGSHSHSVTVNSNGNHSHSLTIDTDGGSEARPRNVALLYCIKV